LYVFCLFLYLLTYQQTLLSCFSFSNLVTRNSLRGCYPRIQRIQFGHRLEASSKATCIPLAIASAANFLRTSPPRRRLLLATATRVVMHRKMFFASLHSFWQTGPAEKPTPIQTNGAENSSRAR